jgi:CheY-like chemotaxis protein/HPt (histidine-containing phosphotransfer) domain-containing protein
MPGSDGFSLARWIKERNLLENRVVMMLTFPHLKRKAAFKQLGVKADIVKPLHPPELLDAIKIALGLKAPFSEPKTKRTAPESGVSDRRPKILVAEDTPFNQTIIMRLLEKHGYHAALVENGRQILEALSRHAFDLVLMDIQMPEMDGFQATREIRNSERQTEHHIPIVAMTAYAVEGDRERCLAAGMDEYVSKPISAEKLFAIIESLLPKGSQENKEPETDAQSPDKQSLLNAFDHDWSLFKELVDIFSSDYPKMINTMRACLQDGDAETLKRTAHSLKGMLRNFQAEAAADTAFDLEKKSKKKLLKGLDQIIDKLEMQINEVEKQLRDLVSQNTE